MEGTQTIGDVPFYLKPHNAMRGVPAERYQGNAVVLTEAELRWDIVRRWSGVAFSGLGKTFDEWSDFGSTDWTVTWGAGFRYLLAKQLKLRVFRGRWDLRWPPVLPAGPTGFDLANSKLFSGQP